jgi:Cdc6-like AAA superfamily ATPase
VSPDLANRLNAERHHRFVGRTAEWDLFQSALAADEPPFNVLYIFGPGGVGKTTLLREFAGICRGAGLQASYVDARNLDASPDSFMSALWSALGLAEQDSPFEALASRGELRVVMVDTYETFAPLNTWISESFLPQLPENLLLVLASRNPPGPGWRVDPGWQKVIRPLRLENLSREESQTYLSRRKVPSDQHKDILDFTHGHPLALSLVADVFVQRPGVRFRPTETPDVIKTLLEQFVQQVPAPRTGAWTPR